MHTPPQTLPLLQNHLLQRLPRALIARLRARAEPVHLLRSDILWEPGEASRHVFFPVEAVVSLSTRAGGHGWLEVGLIGREGLVGTHRVLGVAVAPWRAEVLGAGLAWRLDAASLQAAMSSSLPMRRVLLRYVQVCMQQLAVAVACQHNHRIGPRLARRLLMNDDRAHGTAFPLTHEFLAGVLGVRRVGITVAAGLLQRAGLISYRRGDLTVLDRAGLERMACSCYASDLRHYAQLLAGKGK